ncbi:unnamed protein product [Rhizophagus irregularis]|uniref:Uncharacterized protein n=1 Tax=Rhizophagus irregularis TaxID=588596 RepID=A0A916A0N4_9GLOM|nr:unnamed protein product [Rhizophagus irregularis]
MHPIFQEHITGCMEWYNNFYERYCDEKIYSSQKDLSHELRILEYSIEAEEPSIEWEFSIPNWLDKIAQEHQLLTSTMFSNNDTKIRYELSLNPKLIRLLDSTIFSERNYSEFLRATRQKRIGVEVSSSAEKRIRREEPELLDGNQFRIIESDDDLFDDKDTFEMMTKTFMKKPHIAQLSTKDHTNANVAFIFDLIRFICEMISLSNKILNETLIYSHFGEVVSRLQGIVEQKL